MTSLEGSQLALLNTMLASDGPAALVCREWLLSVEGRDAVIFPPTFAGQGASTYNIDELSDGSKLALIDSVGSQANRMEPLFKEGDYALLVPQITIDAGAIELSLLDAGHRAGDAIARYSELGEELQKAFLAVRDRGDARPLAKIAPTSIVFGAWDSRDTQAKLPRLLAATIRAYGVEPLTRSAQYVPPLDYVDAGLVDEPDEKKNLDAASELGFRHAPAAGTLGGVIVRGEVRRESILNLVALRALGPKGKEGETVRHYLLGLALVSMTHDGPHDLRQGCLLVRDPERRPLWELVHHNGTRTPTEPDHAGALQFARSAAKDFGVGESRTVAFDRKAANAAIAEKAAGGKKGKAKKPGR